MIAYLDTLHTVREYLKSGAALKNNAMDPRLSAWRDVRDEAIKLGVVWEKAKVISVDSKIFTREGMQRSESFVTVQSGNTKIEFKLEDLILINGNWFIFSAVGKPKIV
jgi:hypothetical protein